MFKDVIDYFDDGDVFNLNNTCFSSVCMETKKQVLESKFFYRELNSEQRLWDVLVDPARKIRIGNKLYFGDDDSLVAEVINTTRNSGAQKNAQRHRQLSLVTAYYAP
jgi:S-adenosylmethionine:tRNA ribosyltransferase-isomerase